MVRWCRQLLQGDAEEAGAVLVLSCVAEAVMPALAAALSRVATAAAQMRIAGADAASGVSIQPDGVGRVQGVGAVLWSPLSTPVLAAARAALSTLPPLAVLAESTPSRCSNRAIAYVAPAPAPAPSSISAAWVCYNVE